MYYEAPSEWATGEESAEVDTQFLFDLEGGLLAGKRHRLFWDLGWTGGF